MPRGSLSQSPDQELASATSSLLELPTELLVVILEYLPLRDLTKICLVQAFVVVVKCLYETVGMPSTKQPCEQRKFYLPMDESFAGGIMAVFAQHTRHS